MPQTAYQLPKATLHSLEPEAVLVLRYVNSQAFVGNVKERGDCVRCFMAGFAMRSPEAGDPVLPS